MNLIEILREIKKSGLEFEVYKELHEWLMHKIDEVDDENMELRATKCAIRDIVTHNPNKTEAIEAVKALCEEEEP